MIDKAGRKVIPNPQDKPYTFGNDRHYVSGFMYIPGFKAGSESVAEVQRSLVEEGSIPFAKMYGAYTYCIDREEETYFFAANGRMGVVYYGEDGASNRLLDLVRYYGSEGKSLSFDTNSVCEYLTLNKVYFGKTLIKGLSCCPPPQYVYIHKASCTLSLREKGITDIDGESSINDPQEYFDGLVHAVQDEKVSLSLTGGYDSRTLFANLYKRIPLKIFFSTSLPPEQDIEARIGQRIADIAGLPYTVYKTDKPEISEEFIRELIEDQDGDSLQGIEGQTRIFGFRRKLMKEGYTLQITGDGGVLHKDWEWMQDLPFYRKKHTDLKRFYWQRIAFECDTKFLGNSLAELYRTQEQRFIDQMKPYVKSINTQSYDALYYDVSTVRPASYNIKRDGYIAYAPMYELETVKYSYHLPRRTRFFYNFLRQLTTKASPEIARIPTDHSGTTASSEVRYLVRDVFFQLWDYCKKAVKMLGRKFFRRTFLMGRNVTGWSMEKELRALPAASEAVKWAAARGWLSESASVDNLRYKQLLCVVYMYIMSREYAIN